MIITENRLVIAIQDVEEKKYRIVWLKTGDRIIESAYKNGVLDFNQEYIGKYVAFPYVIELPILKKFIRILADGFQMIGYESSDICPLPEVLKDIVGDDDPRDC